MTFVDKENHLLAADPAEGKRCLVTGASRGIGFATVKALLARGAQVIAVTRGDRVDVAEDLGSGRLVVVSADLTGERGRELVVRAVGHDPLHVLVNNAGVLLRRNLGEWTAKELAHLFHVNAASPLLLIQDLLAALRSANDAHVVNISSMGGFQGSSKFPGLAGYSASKAALACITECLAEELRPTGVRFNCLCLGAVDTPMLKEAFPGYQAPVTAEEMGAYIADFSLKAHNVLNGKVLPLSLSTP